MVKNDASWQMVQDGARWCMMVPDGAGWCQMMMQNGAG